MPDDSQDGSLRVLFADDHRLVREALAPFITRIADAVQLDEAASVDEALVLLRDNGVYDLILLDLNMPGMDGFNGFNRIRELAPDKPIAILSGSLDPDDVSQALEHGAAGYIPKTTTGGTLVNALQIILAGEVYVPPALMASTASRATRDPRDVREVALADRQMEVLKALAEGMPNKEIARRLGIAEITVKVHLQSIYRKLGVSNRTEALAAALNRGLVSLKR
jgi:two-component system, NarL family, nitrate/nitrite response regulator NarL